MGGLSGWSCCISYPTAPSVEKIDIIHMLMPNLVNYYLTHAITDNFIRDSMIMFIDDPQQAASSVHRPPDKGASVIWQTELQPPAEHMSRKQVTKHNAQQN
jgi:hypothetical protein